MMKKIRVLVFPCEGMNAVELHEALSSCVNIDVLGASSVERHGRYIFKNYISTIPNISEEDFIEKLNNEIVRFNIDVIFPTHDAVVKYLSENKVKIKAKIISDDPYTAKYAEVRYLRIIYLLTATLLLLESIHPIILMANYLYFQNRMTDKAAMAHI